MNRIKEVAVLCDALRIRIVPVSLLHDLAEKGEGLPDAAALMRKHAVRRRPSDEGEAADEQG